MDKKEPFNKTTPYFAWINCNQIMDKKEPFNEKLATVFEWFQLFSTSQNTSRIQFQTFLKKKSNFLVPML